MNCPICNSIEIEANTQEAWCDDCGHTVTAKEQPEEFAQMREAVLTHRKEVAAFFDAKLAEEFGK